MTTTITSQKSYMKRIICFIICIPICAVVLSQSMNEPSPNNPVKINRIVHPVKPDSAYLKVTYTTVDNEGHKFVSIKGDANNHKFRYTSKLTRKDSAGNTYKVLTGYLPDEFPGGLPAWQDYLKNHLRAGLGNLIEIPAGEISAKQIVNVEYTIDSIGNTANITILNESKVLPELAKEAIRVIKKSPRWIPGMQEEFAFLDGAIAWHKIKNGVFKHKQSITFVN